jgi:hypothetical protein
MPRAQLARGLNPFPNGIGLATPHPPRKWSCTAPRNSSIWSIFVKEFDLRCILTEF